MDPVEAVGEGWHVIIHPDFSERVIRQLKRAFEGGEAWDETFPMRSADGACRWFLSRAMPLRDDQGRVVLWRGTDTEITNQRRLSERLFNRGGEELYGYGKSEALGAVAAELLKTRYRSPSTNCSRTWSARASGAANYSSPRRMAPRSGWTVAWS